MEAGKINEKDVDINSIKNSEISFFRRLSCGMKGNLNLLSIKQLINSNKVAMSLSDLFCVERHKSHFLDLVKNKLDITFANEQEIMSLINAKSLMK